MKKISDDEYSLLMGFIAAFEKRGTPGCMSFCGCVDGVLSTNGLVQQNFDFEDIRSLYDKKLIADFNHDPLGELKKDQNYMLIPTFLAYSVIEEYKVEQAFERHRQLVVLSNKAVLMAAIITSLLTALFLQFPRECQKTIENLEGDLPTLTEEVNKLKHIHNSTGDINENSIQQEGNTTKDSKTDPQNVLPEEADDGNSGGNTSNGISNPKNHPRAELEASQGPLLSNAVSGVVIKEPFTGLSGKTDGSKLLGPMSDKKEISDSESKEKSMER